MPAFISLSEYLFSTKLNSTNINKFPKVLIGLFVSVPIKGTKYRGNTQTGIKYRGSFPFVLYLYPGRRINVPPYRVYVKTPMELSTNTPPPSKKSYFTT